MESDLRNYLRDRVSRAVRDREVGKPEKRKGRIIDLDLLVARGQLTEDQREVWVDRRLLHHSLDAIGKRMAGPDRPNGLTRQRIQQIEKEANDRLELLLPRDSDFARRWDITPEHRAA